jgi:hypothetical protein
MVELGVLTDEDKIELLDGWIVDKKRRNPPHVATISQVSRRLARVLSEELVVRIQSAVVLPTSQPDSDLAIVRGPAGTYSERHPAPRDVEFLIEVSDSTLERDREIKGRPTRRPASRSTGSSNCPIQSSKCTLGRGPVEHPATGSGATTRPTILSRS